MSDDDLTDYESAGEEEDVNLEQSAHERQLASLRTFVNSVPYECESVEEMQAKLEDIVGKLMICAEAKHWLTLSTWDGVLQW
jgi:proteasome activator subunit 4